MNHVRGMQGSERERRESQSKPVECVVFSKRDSRDPPHKSHSISEHEGTSNSDSVGKQRELSKPSPAQANWQRRNKAAAFVRERRRPQHPVSRLRQATHHSSQLCTECVQ